MAGGAWYHSGIGKAFTATLGDITGANACKVMLVGAGYTYNRDHDFRSDITNEVTGTGYSSGGVVCVPTVTLDDANDRVRIVFPQVTWPSSTISARGAVYYRNVGTAGTDILLVYNKFSDTTDVSTTSDTFTLPAFTLDINNASAP